MTPLEQRRAALATANARRSGAVRVKALVADGTLGVLDVLDLNVPADLLAGAGVLRVAALLERTPGFGTARQRKALVLADVTADLRLRDLADRPIRRARIAKAIVDLATKQTPLRTPEPDMTRSTR